MNATATTKTAAVINLDAYLGTLHAHVSRVVVVEEIETGAVLGVYAENAHGVAPAEKGMVAFVNGRLAHYTDDANGRPVWTADANAPASEVVRVRSLKQRWM